MHGFASYVCYRRPCILVHTGTWSSRIKITAWDTYTGACLGTVAL